MTTEERFVKIENTLEVVTENISRHEAAIRDLIVVSRTLLDSQRELRETQQRDHEAWREERRNLNRDLDRRIAESHREVDDKFKALAEQTAETDKRLNALIEIVDEIIRRRKNGGN